MAIWDSTPPLPRTRLANWPTVLVSWWATAFSLVIILTRLIGRKVRSNVLFREDWIMMIALVPLLARMAIIHVVLIYGTNNVQIEGHNFTPEDIRHREIGSGLVLAARIAYAAFIWTSKLTVSEFLKRITIRIWRPSYEVVLKCIRAFLAVTFCAVVVATLAECQPFEDYWQVIPDPGPQCRQGYAQLLTMGTCDMITDIVLVAFPIPIVLKSGQTWKRKLQLGSLFSLSIIMIAITCTRMVEVIDHRGRQQYRTIWASGEILASAAVSNAVILGSFVRDKGTKKNKYKSHSVSDSIDRVSVRRPTLAVLQEMGSEEDLFRFLGCRVPEHLREESEKLPRPAPAAPPAPMSGGRSEMRVRRPPPLELSGPDSAIGSQASQDSISKLPETEQPLPSPSPSTKRSVNFFDVGGLLEDGTIQSSPKTGLRATTVAVPSEGSTTVVHDFATPSPVQSRRSSRGIIGDIGGGVPTRDASAFMRRHSDAQSSLLARPRHASTGVLGPMLERYETQHSLQDAGGLLTELNSRRSADAEPSPARNAAVVEAPGPQQQRPELRQQDVSRVAARGGVSDSGAVYPPRVNDESRQGHVPGGQTSTQTQRSPGEMQLQDPGGLLSR